ncbi:MAG: D-glycero-D-manno-heptose 1,7-bisphosphate phosphatase [Planctomycetota bacterium]
MQPAVFFDRDGTLIKSVHYINDPDKVELLDGVAQMLNDLHQAGYLCIVVSNQAGFARGLIDEQQLHAVQGRLDELLEKAGAKLDGWYFCAQPRVSDDDEAIDHPDRKPGPGMLLKAASDFEISMQHSWMVGDRLSDALAGRNAGCKATILLSVEKSQAALQKHPAVDFILPDLPSVTQFILNEDSNPQSKR